MKVSNVIPCYNEKSTIERIVEAVRNAPRGGREIIVVDDCSQDRTPSVPQRRLSQVVDRIIYHPVNRGKGEALRSGFAAATGDIILVQDADLEHNPEDCPALLEPLTSGTLDSQLGDSGDRGALLIRGEPNAKKGRPTALAYRRERTRDHLAKLLLDARTTSIPSGAAGKAASDYGNAR
jgi:glycosyltransferase involved in cell wall biosynthesis